MSSSVAVSAKPAVMPRQWPPKAPRTRAKRIRRVRRILKSLDCFIGLALILVPLRHRRLGDSDLVLGFTFQVSDDSQDQHRQALIVRRRTVMPADHGERPLPPPRDQP